VVPVDVVDIHLAGILCDETAPRARGTNSAAVPSSA